MGMNGGKRPGAGKPKGAKNKRTVQCEELAAKLGINPFEVLLLMSANRWKALGYESGSKRVVVRGEHVVEVDQIEVSDRITAAHHACKYLFPQRKAVEFSGKDGTDLFQSFTEFVKEIVDDKIKDNDPK